MAERTERLMSLLPEAVGEQAVDGALITSPANRLYLTGMETSAGYVLVTRREAYFIVDFRYYEAACKQVSHCKVVEFSKIGETLKELDVYKRQEYELGIEDEDILNAVRYHTTARKGMTTLEKVIYIADFISAERDYPGVDELRRASRESLERVMLEGLSFSMCDLSKRKMLIHPNTFEAYNEILLAMKKE